MMSRCIDWTAAAKYRQQRSDINRVTQHGGQPTLGIPIEAIPEAPKSTYKDRL